MITNNCRWVLNLLFSILLSTVIVSQASAHLMVAQHGTLNIKGNGVFMVLSLPVSAFENIDKGFDIDKDGLMSAEEFVNYKPSIVKAVKNHIQIIDNKGSSPLQGLLITPVKSHDSTINTSDQIVIMGRFALDESRTEFSDLKFHIGLFGQHNHEQIYKVSVKHNSMVTKQVFVLTPQMYTIDLFAKKNITNSSCLGC